MAPVIGRRGRAVRGRATARRIAVTFELVAPAQAGARCGCCATVGGGEQPATFAAALVPEDAGHARRVVAALLSVLAQKRTAKGSILA